MPSLNDILDFTVQLDFSGGKVRISDITPYPEGVAAGVTGIVSITQPDTITREGSWDSPDLSGGGTAAIELRRRADGTPQCGTYTITCEVDHPDYSPSKHTKTFELNYTRPTVVINDEFDVFTPRLSVQDDTDYGVSGFDDPQVERLWDAAVGSLGAVAGTEYTLDLAFGSAYYDAAYTIRLTTTLTYQHSTYAYLTVADTVTDTLERSANTPPDFNTLTAYLKIIKQRFDELQSCEKGVSARQDYEYAAALYGHIKRRICSGDFVDLYSQIQDFLNVYHERVSAAYANTETLIPTYDFSQVDCETGGNLFDTRITTTDINNWNTAYNSLPIAPLEFIVGVDSDAPVAGESTFRHPSFVNRNIALLLVDRIPQSAKAWEGNPYYAKPKISDTCTLYGMTWQPGSLVQFIF